MIDLNWPVLTVFDLVMDKKSLLSIHLAVDKNKHIANIYLKVDL